MFYKKNENVDCQAFLGKDVTFDGKVVFLGTLKIYGKVTGDIFGDTLDIGDSGNVEGNINVQQLRVFGRFKGGAKVTVATEIKGIFIGDLLTKSLKIDAGAFFEGTCGMSEELFKEAGKSLNEIKFGNPYEELTERNLSS
jgi:cytoskeletal protein CcmA (bactofilin family)